MLVGRSWFLDSKRWLLVGAARCAGRSLAIQGGGAQGSASCARKESALYTGPAAFGAAEGSGPWRRGVCAHERSVAEGVSVRIRYISVHSLILCVFAISVHSRPFRLPS
jgi:hypothetical protein